MDYSIRNSQIVINDLSQFKIDEILNCGQIFRFSKEENKYKILAKNMICYLKSENDSVIIEPSDMNLAIKFFDLDRDYALIKQKLSVYNIMDKAIDFGSGIRILSQDPLEMIISFIISANNNIPRIKGILSKLCENLGKDYGEYRAFPTIEALASENVDFYKKIGTGYRADYIVKTIEKLKNGFDLDLYNVPTVEARKRLMTLMGVGGKVADCILLFAYHKEDVFPMDTWCKRIYRDMKLENTNKTCAYMASEMTKVFGNLSGYAQQYLFYYYRENNII